MAGTKKTPENKRHRQVKREANIPKPVIKRLAVHAGVTRLQFGVHERANTKRMNSHLLHMDEKETNMKVYINNYVNGLLEELLTTASESAHYRKIKTIQEKDIVNAIKSKGYIFTYNSQSNPSAGVGRCHVPHVAPRKPRELKAGAGAAGAAGAPKVKKAISVAAPKVKKAKSVAAPKAKKAKGTPKPKQAKKAKVAKANKMHVAPRQSTRAKTPTKK